MCACKKQEGILLYDALYRELKKRAAEQKISCKQKLNEHFTAFGIQKSDNSLMVISRAVVLKPIYILNNVIFMFRNSYSFILTSV